MNTHIFGHTRKVTCVLRGELAGLRFGVSYYCTIGHTRDVMGVLVYLRGLGLRIDPLCFIGHTRNIARANYRCLSLCVNDFCFVSHARSLTRSSLHSLRLGMDYIPSVSYTRSVADAVTHLTGLRLDIRYRRYLRLIFAYYGPTRLSPCAAFDYFTHIRHLNRTVTQVGTTLPVLSLRTDVFRLSRLPHLHDIDDAAARWLLRHGDDVRARLLRRLELAFELIDARRRRGLVDGGELANPLGADALAIDGDPPMKDANGRSE